MGEGEGKSQAFRLAIVLSLLIWVSMTILDIYMVPIVWRTGEDVTPPISDIGGKPIEPYHFWGLWLPYVTMTFIVCTTYYFRTKDMRGTAVLTAASLIFIVAVSDVAYFVIQGEDLPNRYTWLYPPYGESVPGRFMAYVAMAGIAIIAFLYLRHSRRVASD